MQLRCRRSRQRWQALKNPNKLPVRRIVSASMTLVIPMAVRDIDTVGEWSWADSSFRFRDRGEKRSMSRKVV